MSWTTLLKSEIESTYQATEGLIALVDPEKLGWKPPIGSNWMTTGQLLQHLSDSCGGTFKGFVTGDWGMPAGVDPSNMPPDEMLPPAEKLPAVASLEEARRLLAADKKVALAMLAQCSEDRLANEPAPAPWNPVPMPLGHRLLQMVGHLVLHKTQLFYYLKLQGKPVNTMHLFGM
jgi:uncharacterized damage-inducible protein DinB